MRMIDKRNIQDILALTPMQEGMFFHYLENPGGSQYFEQLSLEITGNIDNGHFEQAWNWVVQTNEMLRTQFRWQGLKKPVQIILKDHQLQVKKYDFSRDNHKPLAQLIAGIKQEDRKKKFDLHQVPFRISLYKLREDRANDEQTNDEQRQSKKCKYLALISQHHILYDGWSTGIILVEFLEAYHNLARGVPLVKKEKNKFSEFVKWMQTQDQTAQEGYWRDYLKTFDIRTPLSIKTSENRMGETREVKRYQFIFPNIFTKEIKTFVRDQGITLASLLYSAWGILVQKYTDSCDVVFGTTVAGRNAKIKEMENMVGLFINTVPLRVKRDAHTTVSSLLQQIYGSLQIREQYETTSLKDIKKISELEGKEGLFDILLVIENYPLDRVLTGTTAAGNHFPFSIDSYSMFYLTNYDLTVAIDTFNDIGVTFTYLEGMFEDSGVKRLMGHFQQVLSGMVREPDKTVRELDMLTPFETEQLLEEFNRTTGEYPLDKSIQQLFAEQVERNPDHIAVVGAHELHEKGTRGLPSLSITYRELNQKSNQLARLLRKNRVTTETVVGIMMEPGLEMVVSLLAIIKAGGAYLPIDPGLPGPRVGSMLEDAEAAILLTNSSTAKDLPFTTLQNFEKKPGIPLTVTPPRGHIKEFDALSLPDRSLINLKNYRNKIGMASVTDCISIQTTRGCPFECLYCHKIWSKIHVYRSAENICSEIKYYSENGITNFAFIDDCFNLDRENSSRLFRLIIRDKLKVRLFFPNGLRGDIMTPDYIDRMVEAGTRGINLSLETASPRLQKLLKKNLDLDKFRKVVDYITGQHPNVILEMATMHGFPTETQEEAMKTLNFIKDIKWLHFPYIHILKIFPNTEMERFALEQGVSKEDIMISKDRAFHELPETLPFAKSFTRKYQSDFMNDYFLKRERLKQVLPVQARILSEDALAQKYNAYLPVEIKGLQDIIDFAGLEDIHIEDTGNRDAENINITINIFDRQPLIAEVKPGALRILLLDLSQHFSSHHMLYQVAEQPLGLIYLLTHLKEKFADVIDGRIYKSGNDFDNFTQLKKLVFDYQPHLVGIRTLTFFKEFFHETVSLLRQWGIDAPIITGGPYASSDYPTILKDKNIDLVVLGEGEETLAELIAEMLANDGKLPAVQVLKTIKGIAFANWELKAAKNTTSPRSTACTVMLLDHLAEEISREDSQNLALAVQENNLAYVMYTSGSTGVPKGVMVEHWQVNNCIWWMQERFQLRDTDTIVQRTDLTFDPSVWEMFWPLVVGGRVRVLTAAQRKDAHYLMQLMETAANTGLTMMYCPASMVNAMTWVLHSNTRAEIPRLTMPWLIIGAEPIKMEVIKKFYAYYDGRIVNTYGPTEGVINNTWYDLEPHDERSIVPIGKPVANNQVYILSRDFQLMPIKAAGEICIAGESVVRGYLNRPGLTAEKFCLRRPGGRFLKKLPPWTPRKNFLLKGINSHGDQGKENLKETVLLSSKLYPRPYALGPRLYKTGDIGRWLEDGNIEIMGRVDQQVKIRGYRIELGEIERALLNHSAIRDCVVMARESRESHHEDQQVKTCKRCGITSRYPGTHINDEGICEICTNDEHYKKAIDDYFKTPTELEMLLKEKNKSKSSPYDCVLLYAGGRGAAYALYQLVDMGFRVLSMTYDNGYFSQADLRNIKKVTANMGVDHIVLTHKHSQEILKESLRVAHTLCRGCFHTSSSLALAYAYQHQIRVVVGATLSRGQIIENKLYLFLKQGITDVSELEQEVVKLQRSAPVIDRSMFDIIDIDVVTGGRVHEHVTTIDFYRYFDLSNQEMIAYLDSRDFYWKSRKSAAIYSTNCPIKQIGDYAHLQERGFHFYGSATSWEQRLGHLSLENVKEDLVCRVSPHGYENFLKRIGYHREVHRGPDERYICAYIVSEKELSTPVLREYLSGKIPDYMVPSYFVSLPSLPLTSVGKIDKKALPLPDRSRSRLKSTYVAPESGLEKTITQVWQEVLQVDKVGLEDNFFDLGGDSLDIVRVSGKLKTTLSREVPVVMIFNFPTVSLLAGNLKQEKDGSKPGVNEKNRRYEEREKGKSRLKARIRKMAET